ncbi:MAG: DUF192 domain-containing protein [Burkholderiales bacterium]|nr:DUF192 domain-containing protein [Burkholderiales bacterium]
MENINKNLFYFVIVVTFIVTIFFFASPNKTWTTRNDVNTIKYVKIAGETLKVETASTPDRWEKGLSGRKELKKDEGLLFVFNYSDEYPFWMKDMNFAIDIIWIDEDFRVVYIKENATPESYPETFFPNKKARYVLEVNSLFSEKNNLKVGDFVKFLAS